MFSKENQLQRSLFAPVIALSFGSSQSQDCLEFLRKRSANTELVPLSDESQLRMAADGRIVESGYRFTIPGFSSLTQALCPGIRSVFGDISGVMPARRRDTETCSIPAAVAIYNATLRANFELLRERTILVDHTSRSIDAFYGLSHKYIDNASFLEAILNVLQEHASNCKFYRAELIGRAISVYIIDPASRISYAHMPDQVFSSGYYFSNKEDPGKSIKALPCIYTKYGVAIEPAGKNKRLVHSGSDMAGRMHDLIHRAFSRKIDMVRLGTRIELLNTQSLGISDKTEFKPTVKKWAGYLSRLGVSTISANTIVKNALQVGRDLEPRDPLSIFTSRVLASRTAYDLVCSALRYSRAAPIDEKEEIQTKAMKILLPPVAPKGDT